MAYDYARPINVIAPELVSLLAMAQADLARPVVYFASATVSAAEGNAGTKILTLTARRSTLIGTLNVSGLFVQGTGVAADFPGGLPGNKVWAFSAGSDTATVDIAINGDTDVEGDETFGYQLQPGGTYRLGTPSSVTGTILNDDAAIAPMPAGLVDMWDASTLALADGAVVPAWSSAMGGTPTAYVGDSGAKHTFVANSGGLPAVRTSGQAILAASDTAAPSYTALNSAAMSFVVVCRNVMAPTDNAQLSCIASLDGGGSNSNLILQAFPDRLGMYQYMVPRPMDSGLTTVGYSAGSSGAMFSVNGTCLAKLGAGVNGHVNIGGWASRASQFCGKADVLAVLVFNRALTIADHVQIHRRYCELLNQPRPGGANAKHYVAFGDSLTASDAAGVGVPSQGGLPTSYPYLMAQRRGMPLGTWHNLGFHGSSWGNIRDGQVSVMGDLAAATGVAPVVGMFEFANMRTAPASGIADQAQQAINAVLAQCPSAKIILGTSTDDGSAAGVAARSNRTAYNALVSGLTGTAAVANLHLDPNIGVEGAAPTNGSGNMYYRPDGLHILQAGNALMDNGPYGFGTVAAALLA